MYSGTLNIKTRVLTRFLFLQSAPRESFLEIEAAAFELSPQKWLESRDVLAHNNKCHSNSSSRGSKSDNGSNCSGEVPFFLPWSNWSFDLGFGGGLEAALSRWLRAASVAFGAANVRSKALPVLVSGVGEEVEADLRIEVQYDIEGML